VQKFANGAFLHQLDQTDFIDGFAFLFVNNLGVNLRRLQILVSEQF
jgi:adenosylmethionine-8-amino-7-oxononanoate aminotransferase